MSVIELKVYELFKQRFNEEEARTVLEYFETKAEEKINQKKDFFLIKDDKIDIIKSIYTANLIQFLATIGSVIAIVKLMGNNIVIEKITPVQILSGVIF